MKTLSFLAQQFVAAQTRVDAAKTARLDELRALISAGVIPDLHVRTDAQRELETAEGTLDRFRRDLVRWFTENPSQLLVLANMAEEITRNPIVQRPDSVI